MKDEDSQNKEQIKSQKSSFKRRGTENRIMRDEG